MMRGTITKINTKIKTLGSLLLVPVVSLGAAGIGVRAETGVGGGGVGSFHNPIMSGCDPQVIWHAGNYHLVQAEGRALVAYSAPRLGEMGRGRRTVLHKAPWRGERSQNLWAPEMHRIGDRWYVYYAADDGWNDNHRTFVLESEGDDPLGPYHFKGKLAAPGADCWSIDTTILRLGEKLYAVWSGWEGRRNGRQSIYIAAMANPWTISRERVRISTPDQPWELRSGKWPCTVNEAPAVLQHAGRTFLAYSANGFWSNDYCLGLLTLAGEDPLAAGAWKKSPGPVFARTDEVFNVGHCCFVDSPDGTETWILYHGVAYADSGGRDRTIRAQRVEFGSDGMPIFGRPAGRREVVVEGKTGLGAKAG